jgi:RHS repeat-associated protein
MADMTSLQPKSAPAAWYDENHDDADIERYHFLHDANFNVVAITNTSHDPITSNTVERYHYSPYGEVTHLEANDSVKTTQATSVGNEFLYTGRRLDPETGLYYYRHRYYHAQMGRFVNRDPIGYLDGTNTYAYVGGQPTYFVDPYGLFGLDSIISQIPVPDAVGVCWARDWDVRYVMASLGVNVSGSGNIVVARLGQLANRILKQIDFKVGVQACRDTCCYSIAGAGKASIPIPTGLYLPPGVTLKGFLQAGGKYKWCDDGSSSGELFVCVGLTLEADYDIFIAEWRGSVTVKGCCSTNSGCSLQINYTYSRKVKGWFYDDTVTGGGSDCLAGNCDNPWFDFD